MSALGDHRADLVARLVVTAPAGVAVTANPAALPPMILVDLVTLDERPARGLWQGTCPVKCVVPAPGDTAAAALLEDMVEAVMAALGWATAIPGQYRPNVDTTLPMYELLYPAHIPDPTC